MLDGFSIRYGTGTYFEAYPGRWSYCGGGFFCIDSSPTIANCMITDNGASWGGGIWCLDSSPMVTNCMIKRKTALPGEGGSIAVATAPTRQSRTARFQRTVHTIAVAGSIAKATAPTRRSRTARFRRTTLKVQVVESTATGQIRRSRIARSRITELITSVAGSFVGSHHHESRTA